MVKQKPSRNVDRDMNAYKMRTPYGGSINNSRSNPPQSNHVQVAHSTGCCSSKKTQHVAPRRQQPVITQQYETPRPTAHQLSHSRLDSPDPFYYRHGRVKKNPNRIKKSSKQPYGRNQIHTTAPAPINHRQTTQTYPLVQATPQKKGSCCCTIL